MPEGEAPIRVLIVDDSAFVCDLLRRYLQVDPGLDVVGMAHSGRQALEMIERLLPDVVTLDLVMPEMSGLELITEMMICCPTPAVVISGVSGSAATQTLQAIDRGAVDFVLKYTSGERIHPDLLRSELIAKIHAAAKIRVVRSLGSGRKAAPPSPRRGTRTSERPAELGAVVVIGSSTGGPQALRELISVLDSHISFGLVVVQHMPSSFTSVLAAQLDQRVEIDVREAARGDMIRPGQALVAPGGRHLLVQADGSVDIKQGPAVAGHCPSIDVTMESAARSFGADCIGVVLSGMGRDGCDGMVAIRAHGGKTYAQNEDTCVVYGMPGAAVAQGIVDKVASPQGIGGLLSRLADSRPVQGARQ